MNISSLMPTTDDWSQRIDFQIFIESHLSYLLEKFVVSQRDISEDTGTYYKGDFYGLLSHLSIPIDLHYIVMRMNGFYTSADYEGTALILLIPNLNEITLLRNVFKTNKPAVN